VYTVKWSAGAVEDLFSKVKKKTAEALLEIAQTSLREHYPPHGGETDELFWRRGIPSQEDPDMALVDAGEQPSNFIIVYRRTHRRIRGEEYIVLAVVSSNELAETLHRIPG
jgi:hypothetical protein